MSLTISFSKTAIEPFLHLCVNVTWKMDIIFLETNVKTLEFSVHSFTFFECNLKGKTAFSIFLFGKF